MQGWQINIQRFNEWLVQQSVWRAQQDQALADVLQRVAARGVILEFNQQWLRQRTRGFERVVQVATNETLAGDLVALPEALPFHDESVDVVLLPYLLEFTPDKQSTLTEIQRVLKPEGTVLIVGLSRWSWLRLMKNVPLVQKEHYLGIDMMQQLFAEQGFEYMMAEKFSFLPMSDQENPLLEKAGRYLWPYLANGFVLAMRKHVINMRPLKDYWIKEKDLVLKANLAGSITERGSFGKS